MLLGVVANRIGGLIDHHDRLDDLIAHHGPGNIHLVEEQQNARDHLIDDRLDDFNEIVFIAGGDQELVKRVTAFYRILFSDSYT